MKRKILTTCIASSFLLTTTGQSMAEELSKAEFQKNSGIVNGGVLYSTYHLKEITFSELFPKAFYEKSYFTGIEIGASIIAAGFYFYWTMGAGAPAAAAGVSTVASSIGGGGAGSYMAGLSTLGGYFGGGAKLGAAILNGISLGTIGTIGKGTALALSGAAKAATLTSRAFIGIGFVPGKEENIQDGKYIFDLRIPHKEIGSGTLRQLVKNIEDVQEEINDAISDENESEVKALMKQRSSYYEQAKVLLKKELKKPNLYSVKYVDFSDTKSYLFKSPENLIVLSVIAYRSGDYDLFQKGIQSAKNNVDPFKTTVDIKDGYLSYLEGVAELLNSTPNTLYAKQKFSESWKLEPYTLEPAIALITIIGDEAKVDKIKLAEISQITDKAAEQFDSDKYVPRVNKMGLYFNTATIYLRAQDYDSALKYYRLANDSIGLIEKYIPSDASIDMVNNIRIMEAVCLFKLNKGSEAAEIFNSIMDDYEDSPEKAKRFKEIYQGV